MGLSGSTFQFKRVFVELDDSRVGGFKLQPLESWSTSQELDQRGNGDHDGRCGETSVEGDQLGRRNDFAIVNLERKKDAYLV